MTMSINGVKKAKEELEKEIKDLIFRFEKVTSLQVRNIYIRDHSTSLGQTIKKWIKLDVTL